MYNPSRSRYPTMPGTVIDATPIAVDFWRPRKAPEARLFFLTHLHTEHIEELSSSWRLPIYTSPLTARLLKNKMKIPDSVIRELEVGQSYLIPLSEGGHNTIRVSVLDANHVPGAVMFLFQGYFGNILHCGDMRWHPDMLQDPVLHDVVQQKALDVLYLDNTYSAPYCKFPSREDATQQIFEIMDAYPEHQVKIGVNTLGQEQLLEDIALRYGERILVSVDKYKQLEVLGRVEAFTTDLEEARIHTVPLRKVHVSAHEKWNEKYPTISIIPSALFVGWEDGPFTSQASNGIHVVPYSDHSSYDELMDMVTQLAPHQIYPLVKYWNGWLAGPTAPEQGYKADMTVYRPLLSLPPPYPVVIPEEVIVLMLDRPTALLQTQPRRCVLRRGLSPRRSKSRGLVYTSPGSHSLPATSYTPSGTPTSLATLRSSRSELLSTRQTNCKESTRAVKRGVKRSTQHLPRDIHSVDEGVAKRSTQHLPRDIHSVDEGVAKRSTQHLPRDIRRVDEVVAERNTQHLPRDIHSVDEVVVERNTQHLPQDIHRVDEGVAERNTQHLPQDIHSVDEVVVERNTPTHSCNPHQSARIESEDSEEIQEIQSTSHASATRDFVTTRNNGDGEQPPARPAIGSAKRALVMEAHEREQFSEVEVNLRKKSKSQNLSVRRDALLQETLEFIARKNEEMTSSTLSLEDQICVMTQNTKLILECLKCLHSLM